MTIRMYLLFTSVYGNGLAMYTSVKRQPYIILLFCGWSIGWGAIFTSSAPTVDVVLPGHLLEPPLNFPNGFLYAKEGPKTWLEAPSALWYPCQPGFQKLTSKDYHPKPVSSIAPKSIWPMYRSWKFLPIYVFKSLEFYCTTTDTSGSFSWAARRSKIFPFPTCTDAWAKNSSAFSSIR